MKLPFSVLVLISIFLVCLPNSNILASDCKATCKNGSCEITNCDSNALCKCNWLGNPVCKCNQKGIIEEIGDVADDILSP